MQLRPETKRYKMSQTWIKKRQQQNDQYQHIASQLLNRINILDPYVSKIITASLFWAEGSKSINHIAFTNSDPKMIKTFMSLLRNSFHLDESKFHISVHLYEYHDPARMIKFWSEITNIKLGQFIKPYLKPHTSFRKHDNYKGCITVRYYDVKIARELTAIYNELGDMF